MLLLGYNKDFGGSMQKSRYSFVLDLQSTESQICLIAAEGDTNRELAISFSDGGVPFNLSGNETVVIFIEGPAGTHKAACTVENGGAYYKFDKYTCPIEGFHKCQLFIFEGKVDENYELLVEGDELWSPQFGLFVGPKKKRMMT
jgi:hypothetical protein